MLWVGRIFGGLVGFVFAVILTEVIFPNNRENAPIAVTTIFVVLGVFAGSRVALYLRRRS